MSDINDEAMKQALILVCIFIIRKSISFGIQSLYDILCNQNIFKKYMYKYTCLVYLHI